MSTMNSIYNTYIDIGSSTAVNLSPNIFYITSATNPVFTLPVSPNLGDTYRIQGRLPGNGYMISRQVENTIQYNGASGSQLTTLVSTAAITIVAVVVEPNAVFAVFETNGALFTLG